MIFTFDIPGRPAPKGSRVAVRTKSGAILNRESNPRVGEWMKLAVEHLDREALLQAWHTVPKDIPLVLEVVFTIEQPKSAKYAFPPSGDTDKYVRAVGDALQHRTAQLPIITDDAQIVEIHARKTYGAVSSTRGSLTPASVGKAP